MLAEAAIAAIAAEKNNIDYNNIPEKSKFFREKSTLKKYGKTSYMCVEELAEETQNKKDLFYN